MYTKTQTATIWSERFAYLKVFEKAHILTVTLNRPAKKNALNPQMLCELAYVLSYAKYEEDVRAVVLNAKGDVFCAGADLKAFAGAQEACDSTIPALDKEVSIHGIFRKMYKPCIVAVEAPVMAGGMLLLSSCTHVVAARGLKFSLPEVRRGLFPFQVMAALLEIMSARKVIDWCVRGYEMEVEEAEQYGLVSHVCEKEQVMPNAIALAKDIAQNSPLAIRLGLEAYEQITESQEENMRYLKKMLLKALQTPDAQEGIRAFKEKRQPQWS